MIRDFFSGIRFLLRGFRLYATMPRVMWWGVLPAVIVGVVYLVAIAALATNLDALVTLTTPWARGWQLEALVRIAVGVAMVMLTVVVLVYSYVAITLTVGDFFYEKIWRGVEELLGSPPPPLDESAFRAFARGLGTSLRLLVATVSVAIAVLLIGFIPVIGQVAAPVIGACFAAWFVTLEISGFAFDARGMTLSSRRRVLGARRSRTLGFGIATYLLFLVPFAAVVVMPAAVAGSTMLARSALDDEQSAR